MTLRNRALLPGVLVAATLLLAALLGARSSLLYAMLLAGGLAMVVLVMEPALGLVALGALSFTLPLELGTGSDVSLTAPVLLIPAVAGAWLLSALGKRSLRLAPAPTTLPLLLFVGSSFLSLAAGNSYWNPLVPRPSNLLLVQLGQCAIFALSAVAFIVAGELGQDRRWLRWATMAFLAVSGIVVVQYLVPALWSVAGWSVAGQANTAMLWTWLAAMAMGQVLCNRRLSAAAKLGLPVLLAGAAYVVWVTQREWASGWMSFTMAVAMALLLRYSRRNRVAALAIGAALLLVGILIFPHIFEYAGGQSELDTSWAGRLLLYQRTLELVRAHPILGLGPASYRHYGFTQWLSLGLGRALYLQPLVSSHNNYIDIYAQMGLVGLALFLWFLLEVARLGWQLLVRFQGDFAEGYVVGALSGLAGTVVAMMLVDWFLPFVYNVGFGGLRTSIVAWMFLGGLVALQQVRPSATPQEEHVHLAA